VLLTIMQSGASSTLDIITASSTCCLRCRRRCGSLKLTAVGRSIRLRHRTQCPAWSGSVIGGADRRDDPAVLGSWRSTLNHNAVDPAGDPGGLTGSRYGRDHQLMTLGGLRSRRYPRRRRHRHHREINWHLEQGKAIEPAILDGPEIVVPDGCRCFASASLRADVRAGGVAGYLFRPLAER